MMVSYLLDTDTGVSYMCGVSGLRTKMDGISFNRCAISVITLAELKFGAENSNRREERQKEIELFCNPLTVFTLIEVLDIYAKEKVRLRRLGKPIAEFDLLIGATAIHYGLVLVTNNVKHFERMQRLTIENWTTQG